MDKILLLIDDIIAIETERDKEWKNVMISLRRAESAVGDSAVLTHLRSLKELCVAEDKRLSSVIDQNRERPWTPNEFTLNTVRKSLGCSSFHPAVEKELELDRTRSAAD